MDYQKVPNELKQRKQWVNWKLIPQPSGPPKKMPFQINGAPAKSNDPVTWYSFEEVVKASPGFTGIGFVFSPNDEYCGIDFDGCLDKSSHKIAQWASNWAKKLNSYTEISPSGTGIKIWTKAKVPSPDGDGKKIELPEEYKFTDEKKPGVEMYDHGRFFAVTGKRWDIFEHDPKERSEIVNNLYEEFFNKSNGIKAKQEEKSSQLTTLERARRYIDKIPGAVSGQGGHNQCYKVSCALVLGFNLGLSEAFVLLAEWNHRCQPPWSERELRHKLESSDKEPQQRGYLLTKKDSEWKWDQKEIPDRNPPPPLSSEKIETENKPHVFTENIGEFYKLEIPEFSLIVEVDRIRRESHELIGELCIRCSLPGVRTYDGILSAADFNFSGARARTERAKMLSGRCGKELSGIDWQGILEEFCQRVLSSERKGQPAIDLRTMERPTLDDTIKVQGIIVPKRHPTIIFGDGGAAKSYISLYLAGMMANEGIKVAIFDWELAGEDHRDRLERIFGKFMPKILYARCERPLTHEVDRLRRIVKEGEIEYCFYDSIAFACDGPPESAEIAGKYFRALRQIGPGCMNIAHITKGENGDQKPFGSAFWHNGARSTWYACLVDDSGNGNNMTLGLFNRKSNLAKIQLPIGYKISFDDNRTIFERCNPSINPDLASKMTIKQRLVYVLKNGSMPLDQVYEYIGGNPDSVDKTIRRHKDTFKILDGGRIGLAKVI